MTVVQHRNQIADGWRCNFKRYGAGLYTQGNRRSLHRSFW